MSRKRKLLIWTIVFVIMLTSVAWAGCGTAEPETTFAPSEPRQQLRGEGFMPGAGGVLTILAATEDEVIDTALQESVDEGRITDEQAEDIRIWWSLRPEVLNPDIFPREMPER